MELRKAYKGKSQELPKDFLRVLGKLYNEQFDKERQDASFSVFGLMNPQELLFCVSLMKVGLLRAVTCYFSMDLRAEEKVFQKPDLVTEKLKKMVDLGASCFADAFEKSPGIHGVLKQVEDMSLDWEEVECSSELIYVKITRDNQTLDGVASRILEEKQS